MDIGALLKLLLGAVEQGFIYAPLVLGVYITYKILDFPDLSVDGTLPMGAAVAAVLIVNGVNPILACLIAMVAGAFAGMITGFLHVYFKITNLLSGILVMTALYSINLRIMGKANTPLLRVDTMFTTNLEGILATFYPVFVAFLVMIIVKVILDLYMKTYAGLSLRAVGANEQLVSTLGQNTGKVKIIGLMMSNSLAALTGALMCQYQRFADVGMGNGTIVTGLAAVILGTTLFGKVKFIQGSLAVIIGSVLYKISIAAAIKMGLPASDMKMVTSIIFILVIVIRNPDWRNKIASLFIKKEA